MPPRLLWVTDEVPDPGRGGGSIRQYHLLKRAAKQADVDLILAGELSDPELRGMLRSVRCIPRPPDPLSAWGSGPVGTARRRAHNLATILPGRAPSEVALNRRVVEALRRGIGDTSGYDLVQVEHEHLGGLLPLRRSCRWAITLHNLLSVRFRQRAAVSTKPRVRRLWEADARQAEAWERRITSGYDLTIAVSDEDARVLGGAVAVVPNGVDLDLFRATALPSDPRLIFSASFNYEPNIDGATWLCEDILPRVRQQIPDARLLLVGREPDDRVRRLGRLPGVDAHFDVPAVRPLLESARVAVVPLRQGSGTRLKALEAMAAGRPVAGTEVGLEGLGLEDGVSACIAATADELALGVVRLLRDDVAAAALAAAARSLAEAEFGWDQLADRYLEWVLGPATSGVGAWSGRPR